MEYPSSKKNVFKEVEMTLKVVESLKLGEHPQEANVLKTRESPRVAKFYVLVKTTHEPEVELSCRGDPCGCCPR